MDLPKLMNNIIKYVLILFIAILPILFLTSFTNVFDLPKLILLVVVAILCIVYFAIELAFTGRAKFKISRIDLPLFLLLLSVVLSGLLKSQNKMEVFFFPGVATALIAIFIIYLAIKKAMDTDKRSIIFSLLISGVLVSLFSMLAYLGLLSKIPQLPDFVRAVSFSPLGGKLPEIIFLTTLLPFGIYMTITEKNSIRKGLMGAISFIIIMAIVIGVSFVLPGKPTTPVLVSFPVSWSVAVDTLKLSPVFGIGSGNYLTAFNKFLPVTFNQFPFWGARFSTGRSFLLTLLTENGLFGLFAFAITIFFIIKEAAKSIKHVFKDFGLKEVSMLSLSLLTVSFFLYPVNTPLITLFFVLISLVFINNEVTINLSATSAKADGIFVSRIPAFTVGLVMLTATGFLIFFGYKDLKAEYIYKIAISSLANNDGKTTYDALNTAINMNPYVDRYHSTHAQVNLALAGSLAQKKDLTEQDRSTVAQLIQQGIREAKATVTLNPQRAGNWEVLAGTYRSVVPFAEGADQFAIQSYNQAVSLDPVNPNLRIALGGVYFALGRYDDAIDAFKLAVIAKPDLANAHYNLAIAYREKKNFDNAIAEMNAVLSLVEKDSPDYALAKTELDNLERNKNIKETVGTENLNPPQPAEEPVITPPLELPQDATPPASQ